MSEQAHHAVFLLSDLDIEQLREEAMDDLRVEEERRRQRDKEVRQWS